MEISDLFLRKIMFDEFVLDQTQTSTASFDKLSDIVSSEKVYYFLFQIAYLVIFIVLSLLSTSAVVYTVASIYTGRDVTYKPVMSVVPKVWKRLLLTFLCVFISFIGYSIASVLAISFLFFLIILIFGSVGAGVIILLYIIQIIYLAGAFYLTAIWQLSNVVSVLEDSYGFKAMSKSYSLVKGKLGISIVIILILSFPLGTVRFVFGNLVVRTESLGVLTKGLLELELFSLQVLLADSCESHSRITLVKIVWL
ncbi:hypothetical protein SDJN03_14503, partial [Cucurbita argyrosperma subsp. sororia]